MSNKVVYLLILASATLGAQYSSLEPIPGNEDVSSQSPYSSFSQLPQENYGGNYPPNGSYPYYNPYPTPNYPYSNYGGYYYNNYNYQHPGYRQNYRPDGQARQRANERRQTP